MHLIVNSALIQNTFNSEYSLEGLMLRLQLQYLGHLRQSWLTGKDPDSEKDWRQGVGRGRQWQRMRWLDDIADSTGMSLSKLQEMVKNGEAWHAAVLGTLKSWTRLSDWTTTTEYWKSSKLSDCGEDKDFYPYIIPSGLTDTRKYTWCK